MSMKMEKAALIDCETTGLDPSQDRAIEVAVCLYDLELGCPLESYASLIRADGNAAEKHNRIPPAALEYAQHDIVVWRRVAELAAQADCIAAYNAAFDRSFCPESLKQMIWVDVMSDFPWGTRKLVEVALDYGLGVAAAHRALVDVDTMARILTRVRELGHSLPELFKRAARPKKRFVALVPYKLKDTAKQAGFLWNGKEWWRMMPTEDAEALSFLVVQRD